ncbi:MAG: histidine phosphatase family protein [archaeon]
MVRQIKSVFLRHANSRRGEIPKGKTEVSLTGAKQIVRYGRTLASTGEKVKHYSGPVKRVRETAAFVKLVSGINGGKNYPVIRIKKELRNVVVDKKKWDYFYDEVFQKNNSAAITAWLENKIPSDVRIPPTIAADAAIKGRLGLAARIARKEGQNLTLMNNTHQDVMAAVFERLTGKTFKELYKGKMPQSVEEMPFVFHTDGKVELVFRKQSFDVTKRVQEILKK